MPGQKDMSEQVAVPYTDSGKIFFLVKNMKNLLNCSCRIILLRYLYIKQVRMAKTSNCLERICGRCTKNLNQSFLMKKQKQDFKKHAEMFHFCGGLNSKLIVASRGFNENEIG